jgi:copper chaperone
MRETVIQISGMSCGHCVAAVRNALQSLSGVQVDQVAVGQATVRYDAEKVTPVRLANAIREQGYEPTNL